jgi:rod shape determining protein RodA
LQLDGKINGKMLRNFDFIIVFLVIALAVIGVLMIGNATGNPTSSLSDGVLQAIASMDLKNTLLTILWFFVGTAAAAVIMIFDYHTYGSASGIIYWATVAMLAIVIAVGKVSGGTKGWITANGSIQPSELAKLMMIIVIAKRLSDRPSGIRTVKELGKTLLMVAIPLVLIFLQPDFGTSLVYIFITVVLLFVSGTDWRLMLGLVGLGAAAAWPVWKLLPDTQRFRFMALFDPGNVEDKYLYNVNQSVTAVGAGQVKGRGFFASGSFCQLDFIPAKSTDFIFSITAETWGFIGGIVVIALYTLLLVRLLMLSRRAFDRFGSYIIVGVAAMMFFHVFENIGMTIGVMPCTGIPLPFLSYGGSSMVTNLMAIGLVENVCMRRRYGMFREGDNY